MERAGLGGIAGCGRHFDGQLRGLERACDVRLHQRACPGAVKIGLSHERYRQSRRSSLAIALESQAAQDGVELRQIAGMEINGQDRCARDGVSTERASRKEVTRWKMQLQLAQVDSAVALR